MYVLACKKHALPSVIQTNFFNGYNFVTADLLDLLCEKIAPSILNGLIIKTLAKPKNRSVGVLTRQYFLKFDS